jgi:hypothetical protein
MRQWVYGSGYDQTISTCRRQPIGEHENQFQSKTDPCRMPPSVSILTNHPQPISRSCRQSRTRTFTPRKRGERILAVKKLSSDSPG